jgi:hypothetical protein
MKTFGNHIVSVRRGLSRAALVAVLSLAAVGLTQCRVVDETVTGVEVGAQDFHGRSKCVRKCNQEFKEDMYKERERHKKALRACRKFKRTGDRKACAKAEEKVHEENLQRIRDEKYKCKDGCYNEGSGRGGR